MEVQVDSKTFYKAFKSCHSHKKRHTRLGRHSSSRQQAWRGRCNRQGEILCSAQAEQQDRKQRIVILGGTGRVGSSTAVALLKKDPTLEVIVGSRERSSFDKAVKKRPELANAQFKKVGSHSSQ